MSNWSPTLKTTVNFLIANRFPILLWWGPDYVSIYNDAYRSVLATKHPWALGEPFRNVWPEIAHVLLPLIDAPFNGGPASWMDGILLEVKRQGFTEETYFTFAYSPVPDDTAPRGIGGVIATVVEVTDKIVGERRITALRDLGASASEGRTAEEACIFAARALENHDKDVPLHCFICSTRRGRPRGLLRRQVSLRAVLQTCHSFRWMAVKPAHGRWRKRSRGGRRSRSKTLRSDFQRFLQDRGVIRLMLPS